MDDSDERTGRVKTAAIVGLNWGLVHLRGLREAGCDVVALAAADEDRARRIAAREGVESATSDLRSLSGIDLVVVAVPADSHAAVLRQLPDPLLICEKPVLGVRTPIADLPETRGRMFVNYAFGFLATARTAAAVIDRLGDPRAAAVEVQVGLESGFSSVEWFLEAASHPLSWVLSVLGAPTVVSRRIHRDGVDVRLRAGSCEVAVRLRLGGDDGISQRLTFRWPDHDMVVRGGFRPGHRWRYEAVQLDGQRINEGEWSASDCWLDANAASVRAMVAAFRGQPADADRLFDARRALWIERTVRADLSA